MVVVVGELKGEVGKAEAIQLLDVAHSADTGTVAVGDEGERPGILG